MIVAHLRDAANYTTLGEPIAAALNYLAHTDFAPLPVGKYPIRGDKIFALVQRYQTKPGSQGKWEVHRKYIDVQYLAHGTELIGFGNPADMNVTQPYSPDTDAELLHGRGDLLTLTPGMFMLLFPREPHMPCLAADAPAEVTKIVVKISAE